MYGSKSGCDYESGKTQHKECSGHEPPVCSPHILAHEPESRVEFGLEDMKDDADEHIACG
jgi:hypothetical protein